MNEELKKIAVEFLSRVDLKGSEAEAMVALKHTIMNLPVPDPITATESDGKES